MSRRPTEEMSYSVINF